MIFVLIYSPEGFGQRGQVVMKFIIELNKDIDFAGGNLVASTESAKRVLMTIHMLGMDRAHRRKGIATVMVEKSLLIARGVECALVTSEAVARCSQCLFDKMGFATKKTIEYKEYLEKLGLPVVTCEDGTTCAKLMIFPLINE